MKQDLHPEYTEVSAKWSCGIVLTVNRVQKEGISIDVCSRSHPPNTNTGEQKTFDVGGRAERFRKRFDLTVKIMEVGGS